MRVEVGGDHNTGEPAVEVLTEENVEQAFIPDDEHTEYDPERDCVRLYIQGTDPVVLSKTEARIVGFAILRGAGINL
jgi:hypothetical protein